ncbi:ZrgA family zinc uptake protein [Corticibacter populi]|nr:DUF2796 domain-containing protein [Corticibacter populi]RZS30696.1 uncharacterized protein DUF2796 [Corticibacter populi]
MTQTPSHRLSALIAPAALMAFGMIGSAHADSHGHQHDAQSGDSHAQAAHVHGVVQVDIAADGAELLVQLTSPQADITGFEHEASTEQDKQAIATALTTLRGKPLFTPNAAAGCKLEKTEIEGLGEDDDHDHEHAHADAHGKAEEGHAHDHDHEHAKEEGHEHGHADVEVSYHFHCDTLSALQSIEVTLTQAFPTIHTINAQLALPQGQFSRTLKTGQTRLEWK